MVRQTTQRIQQELRQLTPILEEICGLESSWNGEVYLVQNADFLGKKPFECRIEIDSSLADLDVRWRT